MRGYHQHVINGLAMLAPAPVLRKLALAFCLLCMAMVSALAAESTMASGTRSFLTREESAWLDNHADQVRVAPEANYPPFSFSQSGVWTGISSDMLRLLEDRLAVRFPVLAPQNLDAILKQSRDGNADLVTSLKSTPDRDKFLAFTPPYVKVPTVIVARASHSVGKWPDGFAGLRVAVGNGYGVQKFLERAYPGVALTLVADDLDGLQKLAFGEVDAVIMDIASASYFIEREKITGLRIHSPFEYVYELSFAVRKDIAVLRDVLAKAMLEIPEADKQAVLARWISLERNTLQLLYARVAPWLPFIFLAAAALVSGLVVAWLGRRRRLNEALEASRQLEWANHLLLQQQAFTRTIADALPSMIGYWSADLYCRFANKAYAQWFNIPAPSIVGMHLREVADAAHIQAHESHMHGALAGVAQAFQRETQQPDGSRSCLAVQYIPHLQQDAVLGFFVLVEDITEMKRAEDRLRLLNDELAVQMHAAKEANRAKSAFLANMSHEIRTPLGAITGMAKLIRREHLSADQTDRLDKLESAARHLSATISDILDLSKIEADKIVLEEAPIDIPLLLSSVAHIVQETARQKGLQLHTETDAIPPGLVGDETRLRQAMLNFAGNAVKFAEAGSITLRARLLEDQADACVVRLEVQDTGPGIAPEQQSKLFEPFVQADSSTTRKYGGSGLGLTITKRLAQAMGGEVGLDSVAGQGCTFWLTVRLKKDTTDGQKQANVSTDAFALIRRDFAGQHVLLVDDDEFNREIGAILLQDAGLVVDLAEDGQAAVDMAGRTAYALILMDMQMPRLDGLQATHRIRSLPGAGYVPIVAMTANAFEEDRTRCLQAGMDDFVTKPVDPDLLYTTLLRLLQQTAVPHLPLS